MSSPSPAGASPAPAAASAAAAASESRAQRGAALSRSAVNDAQRAFNTAFQGRLDRIQRAQAERYHQIEDHHIDRIGKPNLRYDIGDDIDEFNANLGGVLEARAKKITVAALGPFDLAARNRRLNNEIDAAVREHIIETSKIDVERVFSSIGVRQLWQLRLEFCLCAIENEKFEAAGGFDPLTTEQILENARKAGLLKPDEEIMMKNGHPQTGEDLSEEEKAEEEELFFSLLQDAGDGGLTPPQFVDLIIRALQASGTAPPVGTDEFQELEQGLRNLFSVVDADGGGTAEWDEVVGYLEHVAAQKKAAESGQTQVAHMVDSVQIKRGPCRRVWTGASRKHAALWAAQVNTTYDSSVMILHPTTLTVDSKLTLPTQISSVMWTHQQRHKEEFLGLVIGDITCHVFFVPCESASNQATVKLPEKKMAESLIKKCSIGKTPTEVIFNAELQCLVFTTTDGYVLTYNFWELYDFNTMARTKFSTRIVNEPISAAVCVRHRVICGTLMGDLIVCSLIAETGVTPQFTIGHSSKRPGGIKTLHFLPSNNLILCCGDSPTPTAWLLSRIQQHDPIAVISDQRPNEKPHDAPVISIFSDPVYFVNRFFTIDKNGLCKEWEISLLQCVGTSTLLIPSAKAPFGTTEITGVSAVYDLRRFGRMKGLDIPIHIESETIVLPPGTPNLTMGAFVFHSMDHTLNYERMSFVPIEEMRVKERNRSSSSRIVCCQYNGPTDKLVATLGCDMAFWYASEGRVLKIYDKLTHVDISAAHLEDNGQRVAYGCADGRCYLYTLVGGKPPLEFKKVCETEITMAYCDQDMCVFASKQGKICSYCLTSSTRDVTEPVCEINLDDLNLNVGSICFQDNQCIVGDQYGRVTLFDMVPTAGKILSVMSHRKTLTGNLGAAAAAASAAAAQGSEADIFAMAQRVEKHYHAQRMWEVNRRMWEGRRALERSTISHFAICEVARVHGKLHERLVGLFQLGAPREERMLRDAAGGYVAKNKRAGTIRERRKMEEAAAASTRGGGAGRAGGGAGAGGGRRSPTREQQQQSSSSSSISSSAAETASAISASDAIAAIKEASDRLVYSIAKPSYGEVIAMCPVLSFPCFAVSNACGDIFCTTYSCVEPANVELLRWSGSAPRSVIHTAQKSNVVAMTTMRHPEERDIILVTGDDAGCLSMWNLDETLKFFFNQKTSMRRRSSRKNSSLSRQGSFGDSRGGHPPAHHHSHHGGFGSRTASFAATSIAAQKLKMQERRASHVKILGIPEEESGEDDSLTEEEEEDIIPDALKDNTEALLLAAGAKWYLEESEVWLRAPKPKLASCVLIGGGGGGSSSASITAINIVEGNGVAIIATGEGKIHAVNLFDVSTRMEAGTILGTYIPHKRFAIKAPVGFKPLPKHASVLANNNTEGGSSSTEVDNNNNNNGRPAQLSDVLLQGSSQRAINRWKKIQEYVLGKRIAWFHLTEDAVKKAAFEDEVSAQARTASEASPIRGAAVSPSPNNNSRRMASSANKHAAAAAAASAASILNPKVARSRHASIAPMSFMLHPDDDIQDDAGFEAVITALLAGEDQQSQQQQVASGSGAATDEACSSSSHSLSNNPTSPPTLKRRSSVAFLSVDAQDGNAPLASNDSMTMTPPALGTNNNQSNWSMVFGSRVGENGNDSDVLRPSISGGRPQQDNNNNNNNNEVSAAAAVVVLDDDEDDDDDEKNKETIELKIVKWEHVSPSSTPKAKSKKSVVNQAQQNNKSGNKKGRGGGGGAAGGGKKSRSRKSMMMGMAGASKLGGSSANLQDDDAWYQSGDEDDDGYASGGGGGDDDEAPPEKSVLEVVRPRQVSVHKLADKVKRQVRRAIDDCQKFGSIPLSPGQSVRRSLSPTMAMMTPSTANNNSTTNIFDETDVGHEPPFLFLEHLPRPPRLFVPQVNAALTMPCACDIDVPIPPHGAVPEWIRDAVERFSPFTVVGRLVKEDPGSASTTTTAATSSTSNNGEDAAGGGDDADDAERGKKKEPTAAQRLEEEEAKLLRKRQWGVLQDVEVPSLVYEDIPHPDSAPNPFVVKGLVDPAELSGKEPTADDDDMNKNSRKTSEHGEGGERSRSRSPVTPPKSGKRSPPNKRSSTPLARGGNSFISEFGNECGYMKTFGGNALPWAKKNRKKTQQQQQGGARSAATPPPHNYNSSFGGSSQYQHQQHHSTRPPASTEEFESVLAHAAVSAKWPLQENPLLCPSGPGGAVLMIASQQQKKMVSSSKQHDGEKLDLHTPGQSREDDHHDDHSYSRSVGGPSSSSFASPTPSSSLQQHRTTTPDIIIVNNTAATKKPDMSIIPSSSVSLSPFSHDHDVVHEQQQQQATSAEAAGGAMMVQQQQRFSISDMRRYAHQHSDKRVQSMLSYDLSPQRDFESRAKEEEVFGRWSTKSKGRLWSVRQRGDRAGEFSKLVEEKRSGGGGGATPSPVPSPAPSPQTPEPTTTVMNDTSINIDNKKMTMKERQQQRRQLRSASAAAAVSSSSSVPDVVASPASFIASSAKKCARLETAAPSPLFRVNDHEADNRQQKFALLLANDLPEVHQNISSSRDLISTSSSQMATTMTEKNNNNNNNNSTSNNNNNNNNSASIIMAMTKSSNSNNNNSLLLGRRRPGPLTLQERRSLVKEKFGSNSAVISSPVPVSAGGADVADKSSSSEPVESFAVVGIKKEKPV